MKSQLLYIFVLAAPLLVQLLSREPRVAPDDGDRPVASETTSAAAAEPAQTRERAAADERPDPRQPAVARPIPAAHLFMFM